nr:hypothetical protein [Tanacetum cinerariifolium]
MTTSSTNNSVFRGFFEKQKLTGPNFIDWYRQLRILLSIEDKLDYVEQPISPAPVAPVAMEPEIQRNLEPLHAHEMLRELKTLFAQQVEQELLQTMRDFHSCRQEEGQSVSSYVLKMKGYIDNLERLGHPVILGLGTVNELHAMLKLHEQTLSKSNTSALHAIRAGKVQKAELMKKKKNTASGAGGSGIFVIELNTILNRSWIYDTGCGTYIYNTTQGLRASRKLKPRALSLYVENGQHEAVEAIGAFYLCLPSGLELVLNNCHYAPSITRGVISVSRLYEDGFVNRFVDNTILVSRNNVVYFSAIPRDGIFEIDLSNSLTNESSIYAVSNKKAKLDLDSALLWHCRHGHISKKCIEKLQHDGFLDSFDLRAFEKCYFKKEVENQLGKTIKSLRSDRGGEYMSQEFLDHLKDHEIIAHRTPPYTPQHNGVSERRNKTLLDMVHKDTTCPRSYIDAEEHELGDLGEPANYKAALLDHESKKWLNTMNVEMKSMKDNKVWVLVELPPNGKTIGSKWLFKKKTDMDGNVHIYKARLVAKGYTQTQGIDYEETFSPVADIRAIRILIAIAAYYDYEIWQIDVKLLSSMDISMKSIPMLQSVKTYLGKCFAMKDLGKATYILGIKIYRDISRRLIGLCQSAYIEKILKRYCMENSKRGSIPMQEKLKLSKSQSASTPAELKHMQDVPYALVVGSIMYDVRCTLPNVAFAQNTGYVFVLNGGAVDWKSAKQSIFATSSSEAEYIAAFDASKEAVWVRKFIFGLGVVPIIKEPISMYCDNTRAIAIANESGITKGARHFHAKVHYLREVIEFGDIKLEKVYIDDNLADPFTKALAFPKHFEHTRNIGMLPPSSLILITLHFLNKLESMKILKNKLESMKILENKLESMKIVENKLDSLKLQENQPVDGLVPLSIKKNHREEEDQEGNNSSEITTDFSTVAAEGERTSHKVAIDDSSHKISKYAFDPSYKTWIHDGEPDLPLPPPVIDNTRQPHMSDMTTCLNDLSYIPLNNEQNEPRRYCVRSLIRCNTQLMVEHGRTLTPSIRIFAAEPRNVLLGLAVDGFNPLCNLSQSYNMWSMILTTYNLPPWLCMKESCFMLTLLIPGPKSSGKDIDVYLRLLIDGPKDVWAKPGVETIDVATGLKFNMKAMVLWTINDLPARTYVGHIRFLTKRHKWRSSLDFSGQIEDEDPPREFSRDAIMTQLARLPTRVKDVMHIEKNVFESILNTLLMNDKSKDTAKARQDLKRLGIRSGLWLGQNKNEKCSKPQAAYSFTLEDRKKFCHFVKGIKLPDGFVSKFKHKTSAILSLKRYKTLIELCLFFKNVCSQTLMVDDMLKAQSKRLFSAGLFAPGRYNDPGVSESSELFALACGPSQTPISVNSYVVNGVRSVVHNHDERRTTQNSDICSPGPDGQLYYGQVEQILELLYFSFKTVLFRVKWFDTSNKGRIKNFVIRNNITQIKENEDDSDVIHVDNSSDLTLSISLNDLEISALHIDGQLIDVDAPPYIIDVVDEDDDIIDEEDPILHDLADSNDEDLVNLDIDDGVNMSANVAQGHDSDRGGDDRPPSYQIPTGFLVLPEQKAEVVEKIGTQFDLRTHIESDRLPKIYASSSTRNPIAGQKSMRPKKAALKEMYWVPNEDGTYDMESSATREYPSLIHTFLTYTVGGVFLNPEDRALYDEMLRLQGRGSNTPRMLTQLESQSEYGSGSGIGGCGDDEPVMMRTAARMGRIRTIVRRC